MLELLRWAVAILGVATLAYWTYRRAVGADDDPALWFRKETQTGSATGLVSGVYAVGLVVIAVVVALFQEVQANVGLGLLLVAIVVVHYLLELGEDD